MTERISIIDQIKRDLSDFTERQQTAEGMVAAIREAEQMDDAGLIERWKEIEDRMVQIYAGQGDLAELARVEAQIRAFEMEATRRLAKRVKEQAEG